MTSCRRHLWLSVVVLVLSRVTSFVPAASNSFGATKQRHGNAICQRRPSPSPSHLGLFKLFEESGPLGKGITVGKVQVALISPDRSLFKLLEKKAGSPGTTSAQLSRLANEVCLMLLRKSDDWTGACSESKWFSQKDSGKAESRYNDWTNREASKFEKEYVPGSDSGEKGGGSTVAVVSLVIEIQGDETKFDGAGFSLAGTKEVLSSIASDCLVERGQCVNAVEVFWTPSERDEVLTSRDVVLDFPELIDL